MSSIKGDYLMPLPGDEDEFDEYIKGGKWDVIDIGLEDGTEDQYKERGLSSNGLKIRGEFVTRWRDVEWRMLTELIAVDLGEPFFARIEEARKRQEAKMKEIKEGPVAETSTAMKPTVAATSTLVKRPLANGSEVRTAGVVGSPLPPNQTRATGTTASQTRLARPTSTQTRMTTTRGNTTSATSTTRSGTTVRKPINDATSTTRTTTVPTRKPPVPTARPRDQTTVRPVSSTTTRPGQSTATSSGSRLVNRSTTTTRPVTGAKRPVSGRAIPTVPAIQEMDVPSAEVFQVADVGSDLETEIATLDFVL